MSDSFFARHVASQGYALIPNVLSSQACTELAQRMAQLDAGRGGTRSLLTEDWCVPLLGELRSHPALAPVLPDDSVAVQCTYFEKSRERNWLVAMHQDLSIPVAARVEHPALQGWSVKEGQLFVQAPLEVLENTVAVRLHLDACTLADGPLRVIPASHRQGRIPLDVAARMRQTQADVPCPADQGSVLIMRPLLLHASSKASGTGLRRVLHWVLGPARLPYGLSWDLA